MKTVLNKQDGVTLVATIGVILILMALATQIVRLAGGAAMQTMAENQKIRAHEMAMSGIHLAMLILARDAADNEVDSVQEAWADPAMIQQGIQVLGFEKGSIELKISDELSKIQLNAILSQFPGHAVNPDQQQFLERFFRLILEKSEVKDVPGAVELVNGIKDWVDSNDDDMISGVSGVESEYYLRLEPPYSCANQPFTYVDELLKIKSFTLDLFGTMEERSMKGLGDYFTVYGLGDKKLPKGRYGFSGTININTAPEKILEALLPEGREHQAKDLVDYRLERPDMESNYTHSLEKGWYSRVIELSEKEKKALDRKISYSSHIFRADCTAWIDKFKVGLSAVIKREKHKESGQWSCRIIQLEGA